jgi:hypothetical protein
MPGYPLDWETEPDSRKEAPRPPQQDDRSLDRRDRATLAHAVRQTIRVSRVTTALAQVAVEHADLVRTWAELVREEAAAARHAAIAVRIFPTRRASDLPDNGW